MMRRVVKGGISGSLYLITICLGGNMKALILSILLLSSSSLMAMSLDIKIQLQGIDAYSLNGERLEGSQSSMSGMVIFDVEDGGSKQHFEEQLPSQAGENTALLTILDKKNVEIVDATQGIRATVPAKIKKSLFGGLKSIKIDSEDYLSAYSPVLEAQGLNILRAFRISTDELNLSTQLLASDYECEVEEGDLLCKSSVELIIHAND